VISVPERTVLGKRRPKMSRSLILMMLLVLSAILCGCSLSHASSFTHAQTGSVARTGSTSTQVIATRQVAEKETSWEAAVQTVLNYYGDINQKKYEEAYTTWEGNGSASGQSFKQFKRGYADTVQVSVLVGESNEQGAIPIQVPMRLISIVNEPAANKQGVRQYAGTYTVRHTADGWRIASANISRVSGVLPPRELSTPSQLLSSYYQEINRRQFARAYTYWEDLGKASNQSFAHFEQGYADTNHVVVSLGRPQVEGAAGSLYASVPVDIVATNNNQTKQTFSGTYVLRRSDIPPFDKLGWRIYGARIEQTSSSG
jgi:hypothetical protein